MTLPLRGSSGAIQGANTAIRMNARMTQMHTTVTLSFRRRENTERQ